METKKKNIKILIFVAALIIFSFGYEAIGKQKESNIEKVKSRYDDCSNQTALHDAWRIKCEQNEFKLTEGGMLVCLEDIGNKVCNR